MKLNELLDRRLASREENLSPKEKQHRSIVKRYAYLKVRREEILSHGDLGDKARLREFEKEIEQLEHELGVHRILNK